MNRALLFIGLSLMLFSCTKEEVNTVTGNQAPEDQSVDQLTVDNYINRIYIGLLGRKAGNAEFDAARDLFEADPASKSSREDLIDLVQANPEYLSNLVFRAKLDLIEGTDSATMVRDYVLLVLQLQDSSLAYIKPLLEQYLVKQGKLLTMNTELQQGAINYIEVHRRCIDNTYYDQINMGTENFVVSVFQHFLDRYPSGQELANGKTMVDGANSSIFLQTGSGKQDFIDIFFSSDAYFEGQVHLIYQYFLFRKATEDEVLQLAGKYKQDNNYKALQKAILSSDEYFKK